MMILEVVPRLSCQRNLIWSCDLLLIKGIHRQLMIDNWESHTRCIPAMLVQTTCHEQKSGNPVLNPESCDPCANI